MDRDRPSSCFFCSGEDGRKRARASTKCKTHGTMCLSCNRVKSVPNTGHSLVFECSFGTDRNITEQRGTCCPWPDHSARASRRRDVPLTCADALDSRRASRTEPVTGTAGAGGRDPGSPGRDRTSAARRQTLLGDHRSASAAWAVTVGRDLPKDARADPQGSLIAPGAEAASPTEHFAFPHRRGPASCTGAATTTSRSGLPRSGCETRGHRAMVQHAQAEPALRPGNAGEEGRS